MIDIRFLEPHRHFAHCHFSTCNVPTSLSLWARASRRNLATFPHDLASLRRAHHATDVQLWQLLHLGHPSSYGCAIHRRDVLQEVMARGLPMLDGLRFPANLDGLWFNHRSAVATNIAAAIAAGETGKERRWWHPNYFLWGFLANYLPLEDWSKPLRVFVAEENLAYLLKRVAQSKREKDGIDLHIYTEWAEDARLLLQGLTGGPVVFKPTQAVLF